jgi:hypothetical protein
MRAAILLCSLLIPTTALSQEMIWVYPCQPSYPAYNHDPTWQQSCPDCQPVYEMQTQNAPYFAPSTPTLASTKTDIHTLNLNPARRYTLMEKNGEFFAFNQETGSLHKLEAGIWRKIGGSVPPFDDEAPSPQAAPLGP